MGGSHDVSTVSLLSRGKVKHNQCFYNIAKFLQLGSKEKRFCFTVRVEYW